MNARILNSVLLNGKLIAPYIHRLYSFTSFVTNCQTHCYTFTMVFIQRDVCILTSYTCIYALVMNALCSRSPEKSWVGISLAKRLQNFSLGANHENSSSWMTEGFAKLGPIWLPPSLLSPRSNSCFSFAHGVQTVPRLPAAPAQQHRGNWVVGCHILFVSLKRQNQRRIVVCIFNLALLLCFQPSLIKALLKGNKTLPLLVLASPTETDAVYRPIKDQHSCWFASINWEKKNY